MKINNNVSILQRTFHFNFNTSLKQFQWHLYVLRSFMHEIISYGIAQHVMAIFFYFSQLNDVTFLSLFIHFSPYHFINKICGFYVYGKKCTGTGTEIVIIKNNICLVSFPTKMNLDFPKIRNEQTVVWLIVSSIIQYKMGLSYFVMRFNRTDLHTFKLI